MVNLDPSTFETRLFINNEFVNSVSGKTFDVVNPATEEVVCAVQEADQADVDKAVS
jgi:acyl-CoA reductase-like NAD-dependent aldehyde dehydrogenase